MKNTATIIETESGWTIYLPNVGKPVGNYPTQADAARICRLNGWDVEE